MINKIYKRIHNKYLSFFKFIFYLRYLIGIFFISLALFLLIPNLFDYKKKEENIKNYLLKAYGLELNKYDNINYNSLPLPHLKIHNASTTFNATSVKLTSQNLNIYPKLINIYNYKNFKANKVVFEKNKITLKISELKNLSNYIYKLKNKLTFNKLELEILQKNQSLLILKKINFSNYGYNKNKINGEVFNKKFRIILKNKFQKINFKLLKTGINVDINFIDIIKNTPLKGIIKVQALNSKLKFNFEYDKEKLKIFNSFFRNKSLVLNNENLIIYKPFFDISSKYIIEDIDTKLLKNLNINKILNSKNMIKKINSKNTVSYKSKKFNRSLIDDLDLNVNLVYGRLDYKKKFFISDSFFKCEGNTNLLEEYPILNFDCSMVSNDKKKILKKLSIKYKKKDENIKLNFSGYVNILNNKINFNIIKKDNDYVASKEDLKYFKDSFETILFDEDFLNIFNIEKIKEFILEIS